MPCGGLTRFSRPENKKPFAEYSHLAASQAGHLYALDPGIQRIDHYDLVGKYLGPIENPTPDNPWNPQAISADWDGNVWVVNGNNAGVYHLKPTGGLISYFEQASQTFDREKPPPQVSGLKAIYADPWGGLYVAEGVYGRLLVKRDD